MLGITLEIDKQSVKNAGKEIKDSFKKEMNEVVDNYKQLGKDVKETFGKKKSGGVSRPGQKKDDKNTGLAAGIGGAIGGVIGTLVSQLKPIKDLLSVISGIMQIILTPVFMLLKPFLVLFLKVGMGLYKWLNDNGFFGAVQEIADGVSEGGLQGGVKALGEVTEPFAQEKKGWAAIISTALIAVGALILFVLGGWILALLGVVAALVIVFWDQIKAAFMWVADKIKTAWNWIGDTATKVKDWIVSAWEGIASFFTETIPNLFEKGLQVIKNFGLWIWDKFVLGLQAVANFGANIWDLFKDGLSSISNLGSKIWKYIKNALSSLVGKGSDVTDVDDAYISSDGSITRLNPNDNVIAFQDFSALGSYAGGGGEKVINLYFTNEGFVGDEQTLAEKFGEILNKFAGSSSLKY